MGRYMVGGRTGASGAGADAVAAALWNPSSAVPLFVKEIHWTKTAAVVDNPGVVRTTTRGTSSSTVTPDIDNDVDDGLAPPSGALLDLDYSADPTISGPYLLRTNLPAAIGSGVVWIFERPIKVKPGEGLAIATPVAVALQISDVSFVWEE